MPKEQFRASALNKKISHVQFGISGADEIQQEALNRSEFPTSIVVATINLSPFDLVQPDIIHPNSVFRPSSPFILTTPSFKICVHIYPNYYIYPTWIVKVRVCQHIILPLSFVNIEWLYR
ncbi:uncharacterized protein LOC117186299 isoform X4 [Drosophila miranda]|uniref:uncharacterized protein LOC117186299 isoform X4 n=1 Tax=Drosophila miranda TaxID=7229 RepID=UPI00143FAEF2|nr:uncharacterized protein LOC117186299 isoform X4 [Drosophila miranda]